jgi:hypothetical protein
MASVVVQDQKAITKAFVREQTGALGTALGYVLTDGSWRAEAAYAELLAVMSMMVTVDLITVGLEQPLLQLPSADSIAAAPAVTLGRSPQEWCTRVSQRPDTFAPFAAGLKKGTVTNATPL